MSQKFALNSGLTFSHWVYTFHSNDLSAFSIYILKILKIVASLKHICEHECKRWMSVEVHFIICKVCTALLPSLLFAIQFQVASLQSCFARRRNWKLFVPPTAKTSVERGEFCVRRQRSVVSFGITCRAPFSSAREIYLAIVFTLIMVNNRSASSKFISLLLDVVREAQSDWAEMIKCKIRFSILKYNGRACGWFAREPLFIRERCIKTSAH